MDKYDVVIEMLTEQTAALEALARKVDTLLCILTTDDEPESVQKRSSFNNGFYNKTGRKKG